MIKIVKALIRIASEISKVEPPNLDHESYKITFSDGLVRYQSHKPGTGKKLHQAFNHSEIGHLPTAARQNSHRKEDVLESTKVAQEEMLDWLDRGKGLDKKMGLRHYSDPENLPGDIFDRPGPILLTAPRKSEKRSVEKVDVVLGGDWARLKDAVRASIAFDSEHDMWAGLQEMKKHGLVLAQKPNDRFSTPSRSGYRDYQLMVKYPNGHVGELQIHLKSILKAKRDGHKFYEKIREIEAKAHKEGRTVLTEDETERVDDYLRAQKALYESAYESSKTASSDGEFYQYEGNPVRWQRGKIPLMMVGGKWKPFYGMKDIALYAKPISESNFDNMVGRKNR